MRFTFDPFPLESGDFSMDLDDLVGMLHQTARQGLRDLLPERIRRETEYLRSSGLEEDQELAFQIEGWEEERAAERERILAGLIICYLAAILLAKLDRLKGYFDKTHPATSKLQGQSALDRRVTEYRARFGVDLEASPTPFTTLRELVLARNSVLHSEGWPSKDYTDLFPEPRFVDDFGKINLSETDFQQIIDELKGFVNWLVSQLAPLRTGS